MKVKFLTAGVDLYTYTVSGMLYDVFVTGAADPSPVAQMHLAARLAQQFQAPAAQIAQAIGSRNLRAGQSMEEPQARTLAEELQKLGAQTEFRPAVGHGDRKRGATGGGAHAWGGGATQASNPATMGASTMGHSTMGGPTMGNPSHHQGLGSLSLGTLGGGPTPMPPSPFGGGQSVPGADGVGRDPFAGIGISTGNLPTIGLGGSTGGSSATSVSSPPTAMGGPTMGMGGPTMGGPTMGGPTMGGGFTQGGPTNYSSDTRGLPKLELGRLPNGSSDELPKERDRRLLAQSMGSPGNLMAGDSDVSGVEAVQGKMHMVRCTTHGLFYDKRTSSACRKCMQGANGKAQQMARKVDRASLGGKLMALREDPLKRAVYGLGFALFVGLVPAAIHAVRFGTHEVDGLRAQQAALSGEVGTQDNLDRYARLDAQAHNAQSTNMQVTAGIWVLIGGASLFGWYRMT